MNTLNKTQEQLLSAAVANLLALHEDLKYEMTIEQISALVLLNATK